MEVSLNLPLVQQLIPEYQVFLHQVLLHGDVFHVDVLVEVEVERGIQQVNQQQLPEGAHRAGCLDSLQDTHVDGSEQKEEDAGACQGLVEISLFHLVLIVKVEEGVLVVPEEGRGNLICLLLYGLLFE